MATKFADLMTAEDLREWNEWCDNKNSIVYKDGEIENEEVFSNLDVDDADDFDSRMEDFERTQD